MKLKKFSALVLALLSVGAPITTRAKTAQTRQFAGSANKEMKQGTEVTKKRKESLPNAIGGHPMVNVGGYGIPPHIFGMQHVRKGSHKRTNQK